MDEKEEIKEKELIKEIKNNYQKIEESIVTQLYMKQQLHGTKIGIQREDIWQQLFEMIIPKKFVVEHSVFIIDSKNSVSKEVDLAIIDVMYTPYIFCYGKIKFIPIEAVSIVVECKSKNPGKKNLVKWSESIKKLKTNNNSIARMANKIVKGGVSTQKSTRPIRILCALSTICKEVSKHFDFVLVAKEKSGDKRDHISYEYSKNDDLCDWFRNLNFHGMSKKTCNMKREDFLNSKTLEELEIKDGKDEVNSLLTFNFQLNQLLMLINNPLLFPHKAYVDMFNGTKQENT